MRAKDASKVTCPTCGSGFGIAPGELELVCPACMNAFTVRPESSREGGLPPLMELEVKGPNGERLGQMDRHRIRQAIYAGRLKGREEIRSGGGWEPIAGRPEFAEVFQLVGVDLGALRISQQQIRGWRKTESLVRQDAKVKRPTVTPQGEEPPRPPPEKKPVPVKTLALWTGLVLVLLIGGAVAAALLM